VNDGDEEIVLAFLDESRENLDQLDRDLVALETNPSDPNLLAQVFRTIHTIKGTCGFLGFHRLEALTHAGENLLGALRAGDLRLDAGITTSLLDLVDAVRGVLELIETTGMEGDDDHAAVVAALGRHLADPAAAEPVDTRAAEPEPERVPAAPAAPEATTASETTVRVEVAILDKLMDLVGELVLTRSQFAESAATDDDGPLALPFRHLRLVTSELQEGVMKARLQPVGTVTARLRRVVRDLATAMGKQIRIQIEGEEIGVDKAVNEALRDPLLHLVRNAVDHGIELPGDRIAVGKPAKGTLALRAFHEGGRVQIELSDDGRGVDPGRLIEKAIELGMLSVEDAAVISPDQALNLMFLPGLSTKDDVTSISGRGVGMDVVRSALELVGGSIDVSSEAGKGSVFRLNVPLTLAIMPVLIASIGTERYALPQVDVHEVVRVAPEDVAASVHDVDGARILRLRERLLPLVDLAAQLRLDRPIAAGLLVIVVETNGRRFGIVVDAIGDMIDVVVKPLTRAIRSIRLFGGVTILGDGEPALILDVGGLAHRAGITATQDNGTDDRIDDVEDATSMLLLATDADGGRIAIDMAAVRRLEQIAGDSVERWGPFEVVQYRGGILPLVRVADILPNGTPAAPATDVLQAVVCESSVGLVGFVVARVEDVVPKPAAVASAQPPGRRGVIETLVVAGRVTELLDVELLVADAGVGRTA
jgi:two-component system chemotaxis sensor kinase CheA